MDKDYLLTKTIVICGIVRDAQKGLVRNIPVIDAVAKYFKDYHVFIYENDSNDNTKDLLRKWAASSPKHVIVSLNNGLSQSSCNDEIVNPFFSYLRISKMSSLRNHYMTFIENQAWNPDYMMVVDLDVAYISIDGVLSSFDSKIEWDAVTAFGYSLSPSFRWRYHDTYALTEFGDENEPQTEKKIRELADKYGKLKDTDDWIRVYSAFGGLAIFKFDAIKGLRYQIIRNPDERVEVKCEHFSIYKQMKERGFDKVFINPAMTLKYQNVTWEIVLKWLKRKVSRC